MGRKNVCITKRPTGIYMDLRKVSMPGLQWSLEAQQRTFLKSFNSHGGVTLTSDPIIVTIVIGGKHLSPACLVLGGQ